MLQISSLLNAWFPVTTGWLLHAHCSHTMVLYVLQIRAYIWLRQTWNVWPSTCTYSLVPSVGWFNLVLIHFLSAVQEMSWILCILPRCSFIYHIRETAWCVFCVLQAPSSVITLHCYLIQKLWNWCLMSAEDGNLSVGLCVCVCRSSFFWALFAYWFTLFILDDFNIMLDWNRQRFYEVLERRH